MQKCIAHGGNAMKKSDNTQDGYNEDNEDILYELRAFEGEELPELEMEKEERNAYTTDVYMPFNEDQPSETDEGFYDEESLNMLIDDDEISDVEEGFMRGWLEDEEESNEFE